MVTSLSAIRTVTIAWGAGLSVSLSTLTTSLGSTELSESWSSKRYKITRKLCDLLFILVLVLDIQFSGYHLELKLTLQYKSRGKKLMTTFFLFLQMPFSLSQLLR